MTTSGVVSLARTRLPSSTINAPVRPEMGAAMVAYCSWTFAFSTAARSDRASLRAPLPPCAKHRPVPSLRCPRLCRSWKRAAVDFAWASLRRVALERGLRLLQRPLERPPVQREQDLPLGDVVAFPEIDRRQRAGNLRADGDVRGRLGGADDAEGQRHRLLFDDAVATGTAGGRLRRGRRPPAPAFAPRARGGGCRGNGWSKAPESAGISLASIAPLDRDHPRVRPVTIVTCGE